MTKCTFEHIHLLSEDPEATAAFYNKMFDAEIIRSKMPDGDPRIDLKLGGHGYFHPAGRPRATVSIGGRQSPHIRGSIISGCASSDLDASDGGTESQGRGIHSGPDHGEAGPAGGVPAARRKACRSNCLNARNKIRDEEADTWTPRNIR